MIDAKVRWLAAIIFAAMLLVGTSIEFVLNSDFGRLEVKTVLISDGNKELCGLLYRPYLASSQNPFPSVVIAHGISESKEIMSNLGLELARRGFVVLCLDLLGHGASGGTVEEGKIDPSFGVQAAVNYLKSLPFINKSAIGLVGHSLGGGAVRATAAKDSQIRALVLIAGGVSDVEQSPQYGMLNATFPKNLLVIVGKYDVLFNLSDLAARELPHVFDTREQVIPGVVYGSFQSQTAREFFTPATTHLFESIDSSVILEVASWMQKSLETMQQSNSVTNLIYFEREVAILIIFIALLGLIFLAFFPITRVISLKARKEIPNRKYSMFKEWRAYTVWGGLNIALFLPMVFVGFAISFPPMVFGASIAWWMLSVGLVGLLIISRKLLKPSEKEVSLKMRFAVAFDRNVVLIALTLFVLLLTIVSLLEATLTIDIRIISPIFRGFTSARRVLVFPAFLPFFLIYFIAEGLYLHSEPYDSSEKQRSLGDIMDWLGSVFGKIMPFVAIIALQYLPKVLFNIWVLPSFVGFLIEFLWVITPIFVITTTCSWWFYRNSHRMMMGAMFNALILAWVAAVVFPF